MTKLNKIWKSRYKILEGIWYNHIVFFFNKTHWAFREVNKRRNICSECPNLDKEGVGENVVIRGKPNCGVCGCVITELTACLSCKCSLSEIEESPKWDSIFLKDDYKIESKITVNDQVHRR